MLNTQKVRPRTSLLQRLRLAHQEQVFQPRWWSVFCNAFYFSRRGLHRGILRHAHVLSGRLLDLGCGNEPYKGLVRSSQYVGMDVVVSGHALEEKCPDVYYDGTRFPFADGSFDSVLCSEVLEHVFDIDMVASELQRVLKPGAMLLITIPFCWDQHEVPYDFARYTEWGIRHILEKHDIEVQIQEKTTTYVETLAQLAAAYIYKHFSGNRFADVIRASLTTGIFLSAIVATRILPDNGNLYLNQVIVARRR